jgi:hypothetical protein
LPQEREATVKEIESTAVHMVARLMDQFEAVGLEPESCWLVLASAAEAARLGLEMVATVDGGAAMKRARDRLPGLLEHMQKRHEEIKLSQEEVEAKARS